MVGGWGRVLLCAQRLYYRRDQLDCPSPNGLNHYLPLNKTDANSTGEHFRATMALLSYKAIMLSVTLALDFTESLGSRDLAKSNS